MHVVPCAYEPCIYTMHRTSIPSRCLECFRDRDNHNEFEQIDMNGLPHCDCEGTVPDFVELLCGAKEKKMNDGKI